MRATGALELPRRKRHITRILTRFQKGQLSLEAAADQLLTEKTTEEASKSRRVESDRRLKKLCTALQRERDPARIRELKHRLSDEFYRGDQAS